MSLDEYSAGLMSQSFWFVETKKVIKLIAEKKTSDEVKHICLEENLFGATKEYRARRMYGYIMGRVKTLDDDLICLFCESDLSTQKLIILISILRTDRLFFDFVFEVFREKVILGIPSLEDSDVSVFFKNKGMQSDAVDSWNDSTKIKLKNCYLNFMRDANLLTASGGENQITPPILDVALERYLQSRGETVMIKALTGVR